MPFVRFAPSLALGLLACGPGVSLTPASGSASGYYPVTLDLSAAGIAADGVSAVTVAGVSAYALEPVGDYALALHVQGGPSGPADVVVVDGTGDHSFAGAFSYDEPVDPLFERVVAIGASLTQGVQAGVPSDRGALASAPAVIARQAGAFFPLPLLTPGLFPPITVEDIGPAPECEVPPVVEHVAGAAVAVMGDLTDPETGEFGFYMGRVAPDTQPWNLAVGGSLIGDLVDGLAPEDFGMQFVAHLVSDPYGDALDPVIRTQIQDMTDLSPTLILCTDLYGNDLIGPIVETDDLDIGMLTSEEDYLDALDRILDAADATGAEVFLADLPRPSVLPATAEKRAARIALGEPAEDVDARIETVDAQAERFNQLLHERAAGYPRIHVVPLHEMTESVAADGGVQVGDQLLDIRKFGGLLSLDGVHFSDSGYGLVADLFLETIAAELGVSAPPVDLAAILAGDPYAPDALLAEGLDPYACDR